MILHSVLCGLLLQAVRRQRKEELSRESKETNEKLLKTFLKRQAVKAALGDHRSLSLYAHNDLSISVV